MKITKLSLEQFPYLLRQIDNPPEYLDCAGELPPGEDYKYLCVIGARHYSSYGKEACQHLIAGLQGYPIAIVSGLAIGIDSIAHITALEADLRVVAFPGSGLSESVIYPYRHLSLARKIVQTGNTLLSPFNQTQIGRNWTFPVRNNLMAGSAHATLIIEGRKGSGTLLTADYALQHNREVLIVPGSIFSDLSYGPHMLYYRGAIPVTSSMEILEALGFVINNSDNKTIPQQLSLGDLSLTNDELLIFHSLQFSPLSGSALIEKTSLSPEQLNILLSQMEIKDLIREEGQVYRLIRKQ